MRASPAFHAAPDSSGWRACQRIRVFPGSGARFNGYPGNFSRRDAPRRRRACAGVGGSRCWPPPMVSGAAASAPPCSAWQWRRARVGSPAGRWGGGSRSGAPRAAPRTEAPRVVLTGAAAVVHQRRRTRAVVVTLCLRGGARCQSPPSNGARGALASLSLCENGGLQPQVQGVFTNALSVTLYEKYRCRSLLMPFPGLLKFQS